MEQFRRGDFWCTLKDSYTEYISDTVNKRLDLQTWKQCVW